MKPQDFKEMSYFSQATLYHVPQSWRYTFVLHFMRVLQYKGRNRISWSRCLPITTLKVLPHCPPPITMQSRAGAPSKP